MRLSLTCVLLLLACGSAVVPGSPVVESPSAVEPTDAGVDGGPTDSGRDSGVIPSCDALPPPTALCANDGGWCWANPRPFGFEAVDIWSTGCEAFAVSSYGAIAHRTAAGWSLMESPASRWSQPFLNGISGTAANDVWAVGPEALLHFDGQRWSDVRPPMSDGLMAVQALRPGVALAAGLRGLVIASLEPAGVSLATVLSPPDTNFISVASDGRVHWAVGRYSGNPVTTSVLYNNEGGSWHTVLPPADSSILRLVTIGTHVFGVAERGFVDLTAGGAPRVDLPSGSAVTGLSGPDARNLLIVSLQNLRRFDGEAVRSLAALPWRTFTTAHHGGIEHFVAGSRLGRVTNSRHVEETVGPTDDVHSIVPLPNGEVWLSGGFRSIDGGPFEPTAQEPIFTVTRSPLGLVAQSARGFMLRFDGTTWRPSGVQTTDGVENLVGNPVQLWRFRTGQVRAGANAVWSMRNGAWLPLSLAGRGTIEVHAMALDEAVAWVSTTIGGLPRLYRIEAGVANEVPVPEWTTTNGGAETAAFSGLCAGRGVLYGFNGSRAKRFQAGTWNQFDIGASIRACVVRGGRFSDAVILTADGSLLTGHGYGTRGPRFGLTPLSLAPGADGEHVWVGGTGGAAAFIRP
jgi:hypothetical protein